jgi:hypothetical protein
MAEGRRSDEQPEAGRVAPAMALVGHGGMLARLTSFKQVRFAIGILLAYDKLAMVAE